MVRLVVAAAGLMLLFASHAGAGQSGYYVGIASGLLSIRSTDVTDRNGVTADLSYETGIPVSGFIGHQFGSGLRVETEVFYKNAGINELHYSGVKSEIDSRMVTIGVMGNIFYEFYHHLNDAPFSPYVGLGIGFANVDFSEGSDNRFRYWNSDDDTAFAYQAALGVSIPIHKNFSLDVSYRYLGTTDVVIDKIETNLNSHNGLLGVRYTFR